MDGDSPSSPSSSHSLYFYPPFHVHSLFTTGYRMTTDAVCCVTSISDGILVTWRRIKTPIQGTKRGGQGRGESWRLKNRFTCCNPFALQLFNLIIFPLSWFLPSPGIILASNRMRPLIENHARNRTNFLSISCHFLFPFLLPNSICSSNLEEFDDCFFCIATVKRRKDSTSEPWVGGLLGVGVWLLLVLKCRAKRRAGVWLLLVLKCCAMSPKRWHQRGHKLSRLLAPKDD